MGHAGANHNFMSMRLHYSVAKVGQQYVGMGADVKAKAAMCVGGEVVTLDGTRNEDSKRGLWTWNHCNFLTAPLGKAS